MNRLSHKPSLGLGYPILDQTGQVTGVVVVVLDLDWLQALTSTFQNLPEESITVLDSDGTVLAHVPEPGQFVGQRLQNETIIKPSSPARRGPPWLWAWTGEKAVCLHSPGRSIEGWVCLRRGTHRGPLHAAANQHLIASLLWLGLVTALALAATRILRLPA